MMSLNRKTIYLAVFALGACTACDLDFDSSTTRILEEERTVLLSTSGEIQFPSWSPDGKTILYSEVSRKSRFSYLNSETNEDSTFLSLNIQVSNYDFSPSGTGLVYQKADSIFTYDIPTEHHEFLLLFPGARHLRWSPDAEKIGMTNSNELFVYDLLSRRLTAFAKHPGSIQEHFSWSPDGRSIVFAEVLNDIMTIGIWDTDGDTVRTLVDDDPVNYFPDWSPDGNAITFVKQQSIDGIFLPPKLYVVDPDSGNVRQLIATSPVYGAEWSPDASLLAVRHEASLSLYLADGRLLESTNIDAGARWHNRDNALITMEVETNSEVRAVRYPEMSAVRELPGLLRARSAWLPDGFTAIIADENRLLKRVNVITGESSFLTDRFDRQIAAIDLSVTPDGRWIAYNSGRSLVVARLAEGGTEGEEVLLSARYESPSWNARGTALICRNAETNRFTIIEIADGFPTKLTEVPNTAWLRSPIWSPDNMTLGTRIAAQAGSRIDIISPDGSQRRPLVENAELAGWSPDGLQLLYKRDQTLQVTDSYGRFE